MSEMSNETKLKMIKLLIVFITLALAVVYGSNTNEMVKLLGHFIECITQNCRRKIKNSPRVISFSSSFAAGLFLGLGLFHVLSRGSILLKQQVI